jgi:beta-phosphoglucomutase family hydrolase
MSRNARVSAGGALGPGRSDHPLALVDADVDAWLFDLDGVLTDTARVHAAAWKETFDEFLGRRARGGSVVPFDLITDYERFVDGKPRYDGVRSFLASRNVRLPEGLPSDSPDRDTVSGVGNRKNQLVLQRLADGEVKAFPGSVAFVNAVRSRGARTAVVSASENCAAILRSAGIGELFDATVDGLVAIREHLAGKPAPDTFLFAARDLGVSPDRAVVVEDAPAGVQAGRSGAFSWVVGIARQASLQALTDAGADVVVHDLADLLAGSSSGHSRRPSEPTRQPGH